MRRARRKKESSLPPEANTTTKKKYALCVAQLIFIVLEIYGTVWFTVVVLSLPTVLRAEDTTTGKNR